MILFAESGRNRIQYRTEEGTPWIPVKGRHRVWLSLRDCSLCTLDLPPVKPRDLEQLIGHQIPSLYPGDPEEIRWDYRKLEETTLVFLIRKELLNSIKEDLGEKVLLHSPGQWLSSPLEEVVTLFHTPLGKELMFCKPGGVDHSLFLNPQEGDQQEDLIREFFETSDQENPPLKVVEISNLPEGLFQDKKRNGLPWRALGLLLTALLLSASLILPLQRRSRLRGEWEELKYRRETLEQELNTRSTGRSDWEAPLEELQSLVPQDRYALLQELPAVFDSRARILSFSVKGSEIRIKAVGDDALRLTEELNRVPIFSGLSLNRIERSQGEEMFTLTGELP